MSSSAPSVAKPSVVATTREPSSARDLRADAVVEEVVARECGREREGRVHAARKVRQGCSIAAIALLRAQSSDCIGR